MAKVELNGYDISSSERLTDAQAIELLSEIKKGNRSAKDRFVMANIKLVLSLVQRYNTKQKDIEDMFHVGIVGLMKAIDGFNLDYNVQFSTYAVPMIVGEIKRYTKDNLGIKIPRSLRDIAYKAIKFKQNYENEKNETPSIMEIASEIDASEHSVSRALEAISDVVSLSDNVYNDGEEKLTYQDQIKDEKQNDDITINHILLNDGIKELPDKEKKVIILRYYIGKTQIEISNIIGISQAQVSRLENSAIKKLRNILVV